VNYIKLLLVSLFNKLYLITEAKGVPNNAVGADPLSRVFIARLDFN